MKTIMAALSAIIALTAHSGPAAAQVRDADRIVVEVQDSGWDRPWPPHPPRDGGWDRPRFGGWDRPRDGGWDRPRDDILPERRIVRGVLREGFVRIDDIELRRDRYIVRAIRPNGAVIRLAIDAYDGEVVARERIGWAPDNRRYQQDRFDGGSASSGIEFDLGSGRVNVFGR